MSEHKSLTTPQQREALQRAGWKPDDCISDLTYHKRYETPYGTFLNASVGYDWRTEWWEVRGPLHVVGEALAILGLATLSPKGETQESTTTTEEVNPT